jgi:hypothetical protein
VQSRTSDQERCITTKHYATASSAPNPSTTANQRRTRRFSLANRNEACRSGNSGIQSRSTVKAPSETFPHTLTAPNELSNTTNLSYHNNYVVEIESMRLQPYQIHAHERSKNRKKTRRPLFLQNVSNSYNSASRSRTLGNNISIKIANLSTKSIVQILQQNDVSV